MRRCSHLIAMWLWQKSATRDADNLSAMGIIGSPYMPRFKKGILFWESGGETSQVIDQYLTCLRNAGVFENLTGMIVGDFVRKDPEQYKCKDPFSVITDACRDYDFPILYCPTFGHLPELENPIIPIGARAELYTDQRALLLIEEVTDE